MKCLAVWYNIPTCCECDGCSLTERHTDTSTGRALVGSKCFYTKSHSSYLLLMFQIPVIWTTVLTKSWQSVHYKMLIMADVLLPVGDRNSKRDDDDDDERSGGGVRYVREPRTSIRRVDSVDDVRRRTSAVLRRRRDARWRRRRSRSTSGFPHECRRMVAVWSRAKNEPRRKRTASGHVAAARLVYFLVWLY